MKKILAASLLSLNIATCAMHSSSSSSSQAQPIANPASWDNLLAHPLARITYIFLIAESEFTPYGTYNQNDSFANFKKDAYQLIDIITEKRYCPKPDGDRIEYRIKVNSKPKIDYIVNVMTLTQYHLLKAFRTAVIYKSKIHPDEKQWKTWESLQKLLPQLAIKRLEPYIIYNPVTDYEILDDVKSLYS